MTEARTVRITWATLERNKGGELGSPDRSCFIKDLGIFFYAIRSHCKVFNRRMIYDPKYTFYEDHLTSCVHNRLDDYKERNENTSIKILNS